MEEGRGRRMGWRTAREWGSGCGQGQQKRSVCEEGQVSDNGDSEGNSSGKTKAGMQRRDQQASKKRNEDMAWAMASTGRCNQLGGRGETRGRIGSGQEKRQIGKVHGQKKAVGHAKGGRRGGKWEMCVRLCREKGCVEQRFKKGWQDRSWDSIGVQSAMAAAILMGMAKQGGSEVQRQQQIRPKGSQ